MKCWGDVVYVPGNSARLDLIGTADTLKSAKGRVRWQTASALAMFSTPEIDDALTSALRHGELDIVGAWASLRGKYNAGFVFERQAKQLGVRHFSRFLRSGLPDSPQCGFVVLSSPLDGARRHCAHVLVSLLFSHAA